MPATPFDLFFFAALPYIAIFLFIVVTIERYRDAPFSYSSLSSQFLENKQHFFAMVPFHYGLLTVLLAHFLGLFIPRQVIWWNSVPVRLYVLEITGLMFGLLALIGLIGTIFRRLQSDRVRVTTLPTDWIVNGLLMIQFLSGIGVAVFYPWGSTWYASTAVPYLWSLASFTPNLQLVSGMPILVKLHIISAFLIVGVFPFTRLVHVLVMPNQYLWRKPQVVRWHWNRRKIRETA
jgi:nitrate reductase gamma subunit